MANLIGTTAATIGTTEGGAQGPFCIGNENRNSSTELFQGRIDEVRISNVARYTATFTPQTTIFSTDASTVALYHLDEGTGQTLADASGNNRNGVLVGAQMKRVEGLLGAMTGTASEPRAYGPRGQSNPYATSGKVLCAEA